MSSSTTASSQSTLRAPTHDLQRRDSAPCAMQQQPAGAGANRAATWRGPRGRGATVVSVDRAPVAKHQAQTVFAAKAAATPPKRPSLPLLTPPTSPPMASDIDTMPRAFEALSRPPSPFVERGRGENQRPSTDERPDAQQDELSHSPVYERFTAPRDLTTPPSSPTRTALHGPAASSRTSRTPRVEAESGEAASNTQQSSPASETSSAETIISSIGEHRELKQPIEGVADKKTPPASSPEGPGGTPPAASPVVNMPLTPHDLRSARAVLLGASLATASVMAVAALTTRVLLPLGAPTPLTAAGLGALMLVGYVPQSGRIRATAQIALTGIFLAVQVTGFATTALPTVMSTWALGAGFGLLPTALQAMPLKFLNRLGARWQQQLTALRLKLGVGHVTPSVAMVLLYFLNAWTLALPVLYVAAHAAHSLALQYRAVDLMDRFNKARVVKEAKDVAAGTFEAPRAGYLYNEDNWPSWAEIGQAFYGAGVPVGLLGVSAGCVAGTPWRYWWKSMKFSTARIASFSHANHSGMAHEGAPIA